MVRVEKKSESSALKGLEFLGGEIEWLEWEIRGAGEGLVREGQGRRR